MKREDPETQKFEDMFEKSVDRWLERKYSQFGRWTLGLIGVALFFGFLQLMMWLHGYEKPIQNEQPTKEMNLPRG